MAKNNLKRILEIEGIIEPALASKIDLSIGTINKISNQKLKGSPKTRNRIVNGINLITEKSYTLEDIFPEV